MTKSNNDNATTENVLGAPEKTEILTASKTEVAKPLSTKKGLNALGPKQF